jgi:ABC-type multidrug transport system fused ATPase/permease subunit
MKDHESLGLIGFFLRDYKKSFIGLLLLGIVMAFFNILNLALLYPILSISTNQTYQPDNIIFTLIGFFEHTFSVVFNIQDPLITACILFIITAIVSFLLNAVFMFISLKIATDITIQNKEKIFKKYTLSDYQLFIDNKQGDIIYRISRAPQFISEVLMNLSKFFIDLLLSLSTLFLLISISLYGTVVLFVAGSGYYLFTRYLSLKVSFLTGTGRYKANELENVTLNEYINGVKQIKASESSNLWTKQFEESVREYWNYWRKDSFWLQIPALLLYLFIFVAIGLVVIIIKLYYPENFITYLPVLGTFSLAVLTLLPKLANFGNYQMGIMSSLPNLSIVRALLVDTSYAQIANGEVRLITKKPDISFNSVEFGYKKRDPVLKGITLTIASGKTTAIVGQSGSGKSTIIDLLLRLYDVDSGTIEIDHENITQYDLISLRKKIGFVSQDTFIFNASVEENITFGDSYTQEEITEAVKLANAYDFIDKMPLRYSTIVGDRGMRLSGGERQRIAIARAIIRKPEILILDEATSSLDTVSEKAVQDAIMNVAKKCTTVIVAHRLSTIINADMIYVLKNGKIIESGTHEELLINKGEFWTMYNIQSELNEKT